MTGKDILYIGNVLELLAENIGIESLIGSTEFEILNKLSEFNSRLLHEFGMECRRNRKGNDSLYACCSKLFLSFSDALFASCDNGLLVRVIVYGSNVASAVGYFLTDSFDKVGISA